MHISNVDRTIKELRDLRSNLLQQQIDIEIQLGEVQPMRNNTSGAVDRKGKGQPSQDAIDYMLEFDWSYELKARIFQD